MATDITALRADVTAAQRRHAAAVAGREQAAGRAAAAGEDLQREFGISSAADAALLATQLEAQVAAEAAAVRTALERAGAQ
jgi:hypothetical protein